MNQIMMLLQLMRSGGNPMAMLNQLAGQNPQIRQAMQMMRGKDPKQLRTMAENMAKESGTDLLGLAKSLGIDLPR